MDSIHLFQTLIKDADYPGGKAAVDFYFIQDDGGMFKCTMHYEPYFYIACKVRLHSFFEEIPMKLITPLQTGSESSVEEWLQKRFEGLIVRIVREKKEDLKLPNHLMGHRRLYMQLCFRNVSDLLAVRRDVAPLALANGAKRDAIDAYAEVVAASTTVEFEGEWAEAGRSSTGNYKDRDAPSCIVDIREFDVPYYLRVAIDNEMRVGLWYGITFAAGQPSFVLLTERVKRADPVVMAFDIETTKAPLKFPDAAVDQVMMISYMVDGQGFLVTNREIISEDIDDFEYTPKEGYEGPFMIFNEKDEVQELFLCFYSNLHHTGSDAHAILQPHPGCEADGNGNIQRRLLRFSILRCTREGKWIGYIPSDWVR